MNKNRVTYTQGIIKDISKYPKHAPIIGELQDIIKQSQVWYLPVNVTELLLRTAPNSEAMRKVRLPYKKVLLEYTFPQNYGKLKEGQYVCTKRAVSLIETDTNLEMRFIFYSHENNTWIPVPAVTLPLSEIDNDIEKHIHLTGINHDIKFNLHILKMHPIFKDISTDASYVILEELVIDIWCVLAFMQITACSNMTTVMVPVAIQVRRAARRRNKYSPSSYKEFKLNSIQLCGTSSTAPTTHASPVTHWRKGHIRMQPSKKGINRIWIQPTIVGAGTPPYTTTIMKV